MNRRAESRLVGRIFAALVLALVVGGSGVVGNPQATAFERSDASSRGRPSLLSVGMGLASLVPPPVWDLLGQPQTIGSGSDGVFTILLLGSDARSGGTSRTDTIMVMSVKNNVIRAASIPRDTAKIPDPFTPNPNDTFKGRINAIIKKLKNSSPNTEVALQKLEQVIESLLAIEIDAHALITFNGFHWMVDQVDPITVNITNEIKDKGYWDDPNKTKGVYFPKLNNYELYTWQPNEPSLLCNGGWKTGPIVQADWCRRAMPYVRSRKGSGNSDFKRARRQQEFVAATIEEVQDDYSTALRDQLIAAATSQDEANQLYTSFPISVQNVNEIWGLIDDAALGTHVVFQPKKFSKHIPGGTAYQLKLPEVRAWVDACLEFRTGMTCPSS